MKQFINNEDMKAANTRDVFRLIRHHASLTRKQIEDYTHLSWGTVSNITSRLLEMGYLPGTDADGNPEGMLKSGRELLCVYLFIAMLALASFLTKLR